jgi:hypothetical protein
MLLKDFLKETSADHKDLISLASAILKNYSKNPRREVFVKDLSLSFDNLGVNELSKNIVVKFDQRFDRSLYNPKTKEILIKLTDNAAELKSVLVHELQHALDDVKSQGKFRQEKGDYQTRQSEVNARLAQAINGIESALQKVKLKNIDWKNPNIKGNVVNLIKIYLKAHKLDKSVVDAKRYHRLINRIYSYLTAR